MNTIAVILFTLCQISAAEPKITFEVSGQKVTESSGRKVTAKIGSLKDLTAQVWGKGDLSAELQASIQVVVNWGSVPEARRSRAIQLRSWLQAGHSKDHYLTCEFGLPGKKAGSSAEPSVGNSFYAVSPSSQSVVRIPLYLSGRIKGKAAADSKSVGEGSIVCAAAIRVSPVPIGSLREKTALAGKLSVMKLPDSQIFFAKGVASLRPTLGPLDGSSAYRAATESELSAPFVEGIMFDSLNILSDGFVRDGLSVAMPLSDLEALANAFWGEGWKRDFPGAKLRLRDLWTEEWTCPIASLTPVGYRPVQMSVKLTPGDRLKLSQMKITREPKKFKLSYTSQSKQAESFSVNCPKTASQDQTVQLYAAKLILQCSGTLEALAPDGKVIKSTKVLWRSNGRRNKDPRSNLAILALGAGYDQGPFLASEVF